MMWSGFKLCVRLGIRYQICRLLPLAIWPYLIRRWRCDDPRDWLTGGMMAGDWIKMRGSLTTHPKVLRMAKIVATDSEVGRRLSTGFNGPLDEIVIRDVTRDVTIASLLRVWCACNEHTSDGVWRGIEIGDLDQIAEIGRAEGRE